MGKLAHGGRISAQSTVLMTAIGLFELAIGFFSGSLGLIGDAVDSFADATTSFVVWVGLRISKRGPDAKFHFGYLRAETFYSMLGAIIIAGIGLVVMYESYTKLFIVRELKYGNIAIGTALIAMTISTIVLVYKIKAARSLELLSMKTEVINSATDSLSSISAFLGITLADKLGIIQFDSIVGIVIGVFVLVSSYVIIKESSLVLMDACQCSEILTDIENISKSVKHVKGVHDIRMRKLGSYLIGDMHVVVDADMSVREADQIATQIEERLTQEFDDVIEIKVRIEPSNTSTKEKAS